MCFFVSRQTLINKLLKLTNFFLEHFQAQSKIEWKVQRVPIYPYSHTCITFPTFGTRVVHLLQLMNLHSHITVTQSPQFTLGFTLTGVYSMGLGKCVMTWIYHCSMIQQGFTAPQILCAWSFHLFPNPTCGNHGSIYCLHSFAFSRMSYS